MRIHKIKAGERDFFAVFEGDSLVYLGVDVNVHFKGFREVEGAGNPTQLESQLGEYFAGKRRIFDLKTKFFGTQFQTEVWRILQTIPFGETISYLEVARILGDEKKVRVVANAIGKNPILIIVPCHRVIGSDGKLHGFSAGLDLKKKLLSLEGKKL